MKQIKLLPICITLVAICTAFSTREKRPADDGNTYYRDQYGMFHLKNYTPGDCEFAEIEIYCTYIYNGTFINDPISQVPYEYTRVVYYRSLFVPYH
jgi:hypothetical protein